MEVDSGSNPAKHESEDVTWSRDEYRNDRSVCITTITAFITN